MLEHVSWTKGLRVLRECYRVLKPGGLIDVALPNLTYVIQVWNDTKGDWKGAAGPQPFDAGKDKWEYINHVLYGTEAKFNQHKACYTYEALKKRLEKVGFHKVVRMNRNSVQHLRIQAIKR